jgi:energy-coupling factor transporter transmembrane protein EcfT
MTYRYIFLLLRAAYQMFESRKSRLVGSLAPPDRRRLAAATIGALLSKSLQLSTDVHSAMRSRGFQGDVYLLDDLSAGPRDWLQLGIFAAIAAAALVLGR